MKHELCSSAAIVIPCIGAADELGVDFNKESQNPYNKIF
jgi:hypothetical protein